MINLTSLVSMMAGRPGAESAKTGEPGLATGGEFAALVQLAALGGKDASGTGLGLAGGDAAALPATTGEGQVADILALLGEDKLALTAPERFAAQVQQGATVATQGQQNAMPTGDAQDAVSLRAALEAALAGLRGEGDGTAEDGTGEEAAADTAGTAQPTPGTAQAQIIPFPLGAGVTAMPAHVAIATSLKGGRTAAMTAEASARAAQAHALALTPGAEEVTQGEGLDLADALAAQAATPGKGSATAAPDAGQRFVIDLPAGLSGDAGAVGSRGATGPAGPTAASALGAEVIDMGVSGQWIDRLAREIVGLAEGGGHSRFSLNPPHLGRLEVDVFQGLDAMDIRLTAETDEAARRLNEGRGTLQADARIAALQLGQITVEKAGASSDAARDQGQAQSQAQNQAQNQAQGQAQRELASQMHQQGRGQEGDRGAWGQRVAGEQSRQPDESTVARGDGADGHVRFA